MTEKELYAMSDDALDSLRRDADPIRMEEYFSIEPKEPLAYGGIAGMLGERTGYKTGLKVYPKVMHDQPHSIFSDEPGDKTPFFSKTGKQQIEGAPEGITSDKEYINFVIGLDIPITEKINLLGDIGYHKYRDKIEKGDQELFLDDPSGFVSKNIGIGINQGDDGWSGSVMYNPDTDDKNFKFGWKKSFAGGGLAPVSYTHLTLPTNREV